MTSIKTRRGFLAGGVGALALVAGGPLAALTQDQATELASRAFGDLSRIVSSGRESDVRNFFRQYADVPTVARAVLGAPWRGLSNAQKQAYIQAFEGYVVRKYTSQFGFIKGGQAAITRIRDGGRGGIVVSADFSGPSGLTKVDLQIDDGSGSPRVLDLKLEGVSLISTEREQVRALLAQSGNNIDQLIAQLNAR